jgi:hypothetical protein
MKKEMAGERINKLVEEEDTSEEESPEEEV